MFRIRVDQNGSKGIISEYIPGCYSDIDAAITRACCIMSYYRPRCLWVLAVAVENSDGGQVYINVR